MIIDKEKYMKGLRTKTENLEKQLTEMRRDHEVLYQQFLKLNEEVIALDRRVHKVGLIDYHEIIEQLKKAGKIKGGKQ